MPDRRGTRPRGGHGLSLLAGVLVATRAFHTGADAQIPHEGDRHAVIAITCPYAPFFEFGNREGTEWRLIAAGFRETGQTAQYLYASYEDALRHFHSSQVTGVWVSGGMTGPSDGFYLSVPLVERHFVVTTMAANQQTVRDLKELATLRLAAHPDLLKVLAPQLGRLLQDADDLRQIPNHLRLTTLLFSGVVDALITEKSVFDETLRDLPPEADPSQQVRAHPLFEPVHPRILFRDEGLRDSFNAAWEKVTSRENYAQ